MRPPLDIEAVRRHCGERWPRIDVVEQSVSTNADLLATATTRGDREVLVAEHQTSGRGRLDRVWTSPPRAGLLFSMLIRPGVPMAQWGVLSLLCGVAVSEAIEDVTAVGCALKWPNDLLMGVDGRKAAGILIHTSGESAVIGIGLNVSTTPDELPVGTATSLAIEGARVVDRAVLLGAVLDRVDRWLLDWRADPAGPAIMAAYRRRCATLGTHVRVTMTPRPDGAPPPVIGVAVDVDDSGRLIIETGDGARHAISAGDVEHLRPR